MAGVKGQQSDLAVGIPPRYRKHYPFLLDGRCRISQEVKRRVKRLEADPASYLQASRREVFVGLELWLQRQRAAIERGEDVEAMTYLHGVANYAGLSKKLEPPNGHDPSFDLDAELKKQEQLG